MNKEEKIKLLKLELEYLEKTKENSLLLNLLIKESIDNIDIGEKEKDEQVACAY